MQLNFFQWWRQKVREATIAGAADAARDLGAQDMDSEADTAKEFLAELAAKALPPKKGGK